MSKRPIDLHRDGPFSMEIGTVDDESAIVLMLEIGGALHTVKESGIYKIRMADHIDPDRTNPAIPNTLQRVLSIGSESQLVGRTLLSAKTLFDKRFLPDRIDCDQLVAIAFEALKDLAAMKEMTDEIAHAEQIAIESLQKSDKTGGGFTVPSIGDVNGRCKAFFQRADHVLQALMGIAKVFYGDSVGKRWFQSLSERVTQEHGDDDTFSMFLKDALRFFKFIRNTRNCVEHPKDQQRIETSDFALTAQGAIRPPSIEVIEPDTPQPAMAVTTLMNQVTEHLSELFELTIAFICEKHVEPFGEFKIGLMELSADQRRTKHVRYSYAMVINGQVLPVS